MIKNTFREGIWGAGSFVCQRLYVCGGFRFVFGGAERETVSFLLDDDCGVNGIYVEN